MRLLLLPLLLFLFFANAIPNKPNGSLRITVCPDTYDNQDTCNQEFSLDGNRHFPNVSWHQSMVLSVVGKPRVPHFGKHTRFVNYQCHLLKPNEKPNYNNAFLKYGCSVKYYAGIRLDRIARTDFRPGAVFREREDVPYTVRCFVVECSDTKKYSASSCPPDDRCLHYPTLKWTPNLHYMNEVDSYGKLIFNPDEDPALSSVYFETIDPKFH